MHQRFRFHILSGLTLLAALLGLTVPAHAQELVSVRNAKVNLRAEAGLNSEVLWKLSQGYPLQVLEKKGDWLQVQDFEGDKGWVARGVTAATPHHVVKVKTANLRKGPGSKYPVVAQASYGDVLRTVRRQGDWVVVQSPTGKGQAWVSSSLVWGW